MVYQILKYALLRRKLKANECRNIDDIKSVRCNLTC